MEDIKEFWLPASLIIGVPLLVLALWMSSSCSEKATMDGYQTSKIVGMKCYGTNNGINWYWVSF